MNAGHFWTEAEKNMMKNVRFFYLFFLPFLQFEKNLAKSFFWNDDDVGQMVKNIDNF